MAHNVGISFLTGDDDEFDPRDDDHADKSQEDIEHDQVSSGRRAGEALAGRRRGDTVSGSGSGDRSIFQRVLDGLAQIDADERGVAGPAEKRRTAKGAAKKAHRVQVSFETAEKLKRIRTTNAELKGVSKTLDLSKHIRDPKQRTEFLLKAADELIPGSVGQQALARSAINPDPAKIHVDAARVAGVLEAGLSMVEEMVKKGEISEVELDHEFPKDASGRIILDVKSIATKLIRRIGPGAFGLKGEDLMLLDDPKVLEVVRAQMNLVTPEEASGIRETRGKEAAKAEGEQVEIRQSPAGPQAGLVEVNIQTGKITRELKPISGNNLFDAQGFVKRETSNDLARRAALLFGGFVSPLTGEFTFKGGKEAQSLQLAAAAQDVIENGRADDTNEAILVAARDLAASMGGDAPPEVKDILKQSPSKKKFNFRRMTTGGLRRLKDKEARNPTLTDDQLRELDEELKGRSRKHKRKPR